MKMIDKYDNLDSAEMIQEEKSKAVKFGTITIIEFSDELGDHPCATGPPMTISWEAKKVKTLNIEIYELFRDRRRDKVGLALTIPERTEALKRSGYEDDEILAAVAAGQRIKYERYMSACFDPDPIQSTTNPSVPLVDNDAGKISLPGTELTIELPQTVHPQMRSPTLCPS